MAEIDLKALFDLPPAAAIDFFKSKGYEFSWNWWEVWQEAHSTAFTVAKTTRLAVLETIRAEVQRLLDEGITEREFRKALEPRLKTLGWWGKKIVVDSQGDAEVVQEGSPWRLKTIYQTNAQTAYMAGRYRAQQDNAADRPYWQYVAVMDRRTRPSHAALDGRVFRFDDPFWDSFYPPLGFNCRCRVRALSERRLKKQGLEVERSEGRLGEREVKVGVDKRTGEEIRRPQTTFRTLGPDGRDVLLSPDPGWSYNPGRAGGQPALRNLTEKLAGQTPAIATPIVADLVRSEVFRRWWAQPEGNFPLVVLPEADTAAIGAKTPIGNLSPETLAKQQRRHPDLTPDEYAAAQTVIDQATAKVQDSPTTLIYVLDQSDERSGGYVLVVKATRTGEAVFVTSYRRLSRQDAIRDAEIARLLAKGGNREG